MKALKSIFNKISGLETAADLKKNKLTLADLITVKLCFNDLLCSGEAETISKAAADFYRRNGFTVTKSGISYNITRGGIGDE